MPRPSSRVEPDGEFRRLAGRAIGVIFIVGGLLTCALAASLGGSGSMMMGVMAGVGAAGVLGGVVMWLLPWQRWPRRASL